jgi:hypothetical protein
MMSLYTHTQSLRHLSKLKFTRRNYSSGISRMFLRVFYFNSSPHGDPLHNVKVGVRYAVNVKRNMKPIFYTETILIGMSN